MDEIIKMNNAASIDKIEEGLISVTDFVEMYKSMASNQEKNSYLKSIIKTEYVPYLVKQFWARQIITGANFTEDGKVHFDGIKQYLSYIYTVLNLYTKLDIPSTSFNIYFDLLNEAGIIEKIEHVLPNDFKEFQLVYKMTENDFRANYAEAHIDVSEISAQVEIGVLNGVNKVMELILNAMQDEQLMGEIQKVINQNQDN